MKRSYLLILPVIMFTAMLNTGPVHAGPIKKALDPDCNVEKAARGAVRKAVIGVGNRCDADETARDVTGVDGKGDEIRDRQDERRKRRD